MQLLARPDGPEDEGSGGGFRRRGITHIFAPWQVKGFPFLADSREVWG
ncbi:MAG TPA: hypothetical protein VFS20_01770 [Longimicrobium sp.]|nr:hypothetical protein [Longimicrobium sp.]